MKVASHRSGTATRTSGHRMPSSCAASQAYAQTSLSGLQTPLADTSRLRPNSQATSSVRSKLSSTRQRKTIRTTCALLSVPFRPSKLTVQRFPGTLQSGPCPFHARRYTLTHNDLTGQLLLTIGHQYNRKQLSGWYNRLLRDEILAYWQFSNDRPVLHIKCHVSGEETWLAPPILRDYIFRREMPLVLNVINFAEAALLADNPLMADAQVMVHLSSHVQAYHANVLWGKLSDCSSWQPPPRWARTRLVTPSSSPVISSLASTSGPQHSLRDAAQQGLALTAAEDSMQDRPCVLPATDLEPNVQVSSADRLDSMCQEQSEAQSSEPPEMDADVTMASASQEGSMPGSRRPRQNAACYRLHMA